MSASKSSSSAAVNLPQLQNLMKRDPESYLEELEQQLRHFSATLKVFEMSPADHNRYSVKALGSLLFKLTA